MPLTRQPESSRPATLQSPATRFNQMFHIIEHLTGQASGVIRWRTSCKLAALFQSGQVNPTRAREY